VRVLHVIQALGVGGAERVAIALVRALADAGHEAAVAAADGELAAELPAQVERFTFPLVERRPARLLAATRAVGRAQRRFRPDLVHAHNPAVALAVGLATVRGRRRPGLASIHGVPDEDYRAAARVLRLAGLRVVACGPAVAAGLSDAGLVPAETIPNGVPPAPPPADRTALERELGIPAGRPLLVAVGRLAPPKDPLLAVRALADVPEATLLLVGDGPLRAEAQHAAVDAGVADRVVFAGVRADARALVAAADVAVIASRSEGLPLAALEALAAGTPLAATSVRGLRELLADGETALLTPAGDPAALAGAIRRLLADAGLRHALVARGLQEAARHTEDAMVKAYMRTYGRLSA
jgi:glycosyltransferase involved in cell wall biosynthesis